MTPIIANKMINFETWLWIPILKKIFFQGNPITGYNITSYSFVIGIYAEQFFSSNEFCCLFFKNHFVFFQQTPEKNSSTRSS